MARDGHPYAEHRAHHVSRSRVKHILKAYGGGTSSSAQADTAPERVLTRAPKSAPMKVEGKAAPHRLDRPARANGGRVKGKGATTVNITVAPQTGPGGGGGGGAPMIPPPIPPMAAAPPMPPRPMPPMAPPGLGGAGPMPPGMPPPRASGGRVKGTPAYEESLRLGTQVSHTSGKNDLANIGRGPAITKASGGRIEAPGQDSKSRSGYPHMRYGSGGEKGREEKIALQKRSTRAGVPG